MKIEEAVVLITGANRGLGRELVNASLEAGAKRVYAGAREPESLAELARASNGRVVPVRLDITLASSLARAAELAPDVDLLINNAGVLASHRLLSSDEADIARDFAINLFGTLSASKAFLPALKRAASTGQAALVNLLSVVSLANMPAIAAYSASKAAAASITQALRAELRPLNISVHGVFAGAIDTDMTRGMSMAKASPQDVARAILDGVERGLEDIFPDDMARAAFATWQKDPKELERQLAAMSG